VQDFQTGNYETALVDLQQITAADEANGYAWLLTSHAQFALQRFAESAISLRRALTLLPENEWGQILDRYRDYYRATRYTTHLRALENFSAAHPAEPTAHLLLGYHYGFLGYRPQAIGQLQRATVDKIDRLLLAHFGGQPVTTPLMLPQVAAPAGLPRVDFPRPAPETLEPPTAPSLPRAF
jgi:tetratricopeptide (TPR) repeat protein